MLSPLCYVDMEVMQPGVVATAWRGCNLEVVATAGMSCNLEVVATARMSCNREWWRHGGDAIRSGGGSMEVMQPGGGGDMEVVQPGWWW